VTEKYFEIGLLVTHPNFLGEASQNMLLHEWLGVSSTLAAAESPKSLIEEFSNGNGKLRTFPRAIAACSLQY
jgi:hypothetical protein